MLMTARSPFPFLVTKTGRPVAWHYIDKGYIEIEEVPGKEGEESYHKMQKELYPERSPILKALVDGASREPD